MNSKKEGTNIFNARYEAFYLQYAGELIFFARKFVDHQTAEDIVQDLFLKIWDRKSTVIAESEIKNYLRSMVQNACIDYLKHQSIENSFLQKSIMQLQLDELKYYESTSDHFQEAENIDVLYASIETMPPKRKEVFKKFFLEEQKHADIALELNISVRTVETHIYQALKFLREKVIMLLTLILLCL